MSIAHIINKHLLLLFLCVICGVILFAETLEASSVAPFRLTNLGAEHDVFYQFETNKYSSGVKNTKHSLDQTINISAGAFLYHPKFVDLNFVLGLGSNHEYLDTDGQGTENLNGTRIDVDLNGSLLKEHPYTLDFFTRTSKDYIPRVYSGSYTQDQDSLGGTFTLKEGPVPFSLYYSHLEISTSGLPQDRASETNTWGGSLSFSIDIDKKVHTNNTSISFFSTERDEDVAADAQNADVTFVELVNNWTLKRGGQTYRLISRASQREDTGSFPEETDTWNEDLYLKLGKALETGAEYDWRSQILNTLDREDEKTRLWARHKLFESLQTYLEWNKRQTVYDDGEDHEQGTKVSLNYSKKLPNDSKLFAKVGYGIKEVERDSDLTEFPVTNETLIIQDSSINYLNEPFVVSGSVIVRDAARITLYVEGVDYDLFQVGDLTEIVRIPSGLILDGQVLSIDYSVETDPAFTYQVRTQVFEIGATFFKNRYSIVGRAIIDDQKQLDGEDTMFTGADRSQVEIVGRANLDPWAFSLHLAHIEREDSGREYYISESARYVWKPHKWTSLSLGLSHSFHVYDDETDNSELDDTEHTLRFNVNYHKRLSRRWDFNLRGDIDQRWGRSDDRLSWGENMSLTYRHNRLSLEFRGSHRQTSVNNEESTELLFTMRLLRKYF